MEEVMASQGQAHNGHNLVEISKSCEVDVNESTQNPSAGSYSSSATVVSPSSKSSDQRDETLTSYSQKNPELKSPQEIHAETTSMNCLETSKKDGTLTVHHHHHHYHKGEKEAQPIMPHNSQVLFFGPAQVLEKLKADGKRKSKLTFDQIVILSLLSGVFIGFGGMLANLTGGNSPKLETENPGLQKFFSAAVFPIGLVLTVMTGAELFTGNTAVVLIGLFSRKWRTKKFIIHYLQFSWNLLLSYIFNMIGGFMVAYFFVYLSQPCCTAHYVTYAQNVAVAKVSKTFGQLVLLGIACNMLVVLAIMIVNAASTVEGKILGIWFPIMTFVACGLEHSVANAYYIPIGMLYGANVSVYDFLIGNMLPVTIGNIIGGSIMIACLMHYVYDFRQQHKRFIFDQLEKLWKKIKQAYHARQYRNSKSELTTPNNSIEMQEPIQVV